jgi:hypothetical protein
MFSIGNRLLCCQAHPDFNQSVQEEINEAEYFTSKVIHKEAHELSWNESGARFNAGGDQPIRETRNMVHEIIRNFLEMDSK